MPQNKLFAVQIKFWYGNASGFASSSYILLFYDISRPKLAILPIRKAVFHSCISPPLAKNYDNKIIFLGSLAAEKSCAAPPIAENF